MLPKLHTVHCIYMMAILLFNHYVHTHTYDGDVSVFYTLQVVFSLLVYEI